MEQKDRTNKLKLPGCWTATSRSSGARDPKPNPIRKNGHQIQRKREAYCSDRIWEWTSTWTELGWLL